MVQLMLQPATLKFLKEIKKNNDRAWFEKNRAKADAAKADFEAFINEVLTELSRTDKRLADLTAKDCIYRIYRDVRFSKNKDPYKTHLAASINAGGRKSGRAGIYIHVEPGTKSFIAGGLWMPDQPVLKAIRQEIQYHTAEFKKIVGNKTFIMRYGGLEDIKLKTVPKGFDKGDADIELYKYTSYIASHDFSEKEVLSASIIKDCSNAYKAILPLLDFLNRNIHN